MPSSLPEPVIDSGRPLHASGQPHAVAAGGLLFFSALRGVAEDGDIPHDVTVQAQLIVEAVQSTLRSRGGDLRYVARLGIYMTDLKQRPGVNRVFEAAFSHKPARFAVQVADLGGPGDASALLVDVVAVDPAHQQTVSRQPTKGSDS